MSNPELFQQMHTLAQRCASLHISSSHQDLWEQLEQLKVHLHFPTVSADVGCLLNLFVKMTKSRCIFEFGSGYGHSCFWYFLNGNDQFIEQIYLTERRDDLQGHFANLPWPKQWRQKIDYWQGDAFSRLRDVEHLDFVLVDGEKAQYGDFIDCLESKLRAEAMIVIDNSFWKGAAVSDCSKKSSVAIRALHQQLKSHPLYFYQFLPIGDGIIVLTKK